MLHARVEPHDGIIDNLVGIALFVNQLLVQLGQLHAQAGEHLQVVQLERNVRQAQMLKYNRVVELVHRWSGQVRKAFNRTHLRIHTSRVLGHHELHTLHRSAGMNVFPLFHELGKCTHNRKARIQFHDLGYTNSKREERLNSLL